MEPSIEQIANAKRKIRKFLDRSAPGLGDPILSLRDSDNGQLPAMKLVWKSEDGKSPKLDSITRTQLGKRALDSVIVECRVFFLAKEDCYLPGVVKALQTLSPDRARALDPLKKHVGLVIRNGALVSPEGGAGMYSGRLEMDNGAGPGKLLGSDQIAMDYIYGIALHEDEERIARLNNISDMDSIRFAVLIQLDRVLRVVENVRAQVLADIGAEHFMLEGPR
ncbi:hypothetical protein FB472_2654 [Rhodoglobus vestalii]|uniref:Uncharacterized protein n=1 Tax=Rhodoglobus vestalii TaxID=193384 RepID=A0A8H2PZT1_9MICO|nr:hypothetical protein [Rhodoglobus vestalii]TQO20993.1 hypothetical protein FB472_2654 [Rhodoglobus vestalii]